MKPNKKQLAFTAFAIAMIVACNKKGQVNTNSPDISKDTTISGTWTLDGVLHVKQGATLTIAPGTVVTAKTDDDNIDILVIDQGAKLIARGTKDNPIILTSAEAERKAKAGLEILGKDAWGGIVINGYAKINTGATGVGEFTPTGSYGGTNDEDNSGELSHVYLKYTGFSFDEDHQLNGFSFYAVGSGTKLENLAVYKGFDDAFEFFGGTAKLTNVLASSTVDDSIDWTDGWRGSITNAVVILTKESDKGIEADNQELNNTRTPFSNPTLDNVFIYQEDGADKTAMNLRRGTKGILKNLYVWSVGTGIKIDDASTKANLEDNSLRFENVNIDSGIAKFVYNETKPTDSDEKKNHYNAIKAKLQSNPEIKRNAAVNASSPKALPDFVTGMKAKMGIK